MRVGEFVHIEEFACRATGAQVDSAPGGLPYTGGAI